MRRIEKLCSYLPRARTFADVGCDHGYCTAYMLKSGLCDRAYISDVSAKSLKKAETLLKDYILAGRCVPVLADGLKGLKEPCDLVLIAGMGGGEIVKILSDSLPERLVLQPMKNAERVRAHLSGRVCFVTDETFRVGKLFYDIVVTERGSETLSPLEIKYGRDNVRHPNGDFRSWARKKLAASEAFLAQARTQEARRELGERIEELRGLLHEDQ